MDIICAAVPFVPAVGAVRHAGKIKKLFKASDKVADVAKAADEASDIASIASRVERHHLLPKQFAEKFRKAGLDIEQYVEKTEAAAHRLKPKGVHTGQNNWNKQWKQFFDQNPNATKEQILEQLDKMKEAKQSAQ